MESPSANRPGLLITVHCTLIDIYQERCQSNCYNVGDIFPMAFVVKKKGRTLGPALVGYLRLSLTEIFQKLVGFFQFFFKFFHIIGTVLL